MAELTLFIQGTPVRCSVDRDTDGFVVRVAGVTHRVRAFEVGPGTVCLTSAGRSRVVWVAHDQTRRFLQIDGCTFEYTSASESGDPSAARATNHDSLTAPMPGAVTQVLVRQDDEVTRGQPLVIVEAMKMEHVVRAPRSGRVRTVSARPGDQVEAGAILVELIGRPDESAR